MGTEEVYSGLIDRILAARHEPISPELLADFENGRTSVEIDETGGEVAVTRALSPRWQGHIDAIDWVLDLLVPAARQLVMLSEYPAGTGSVRKGEVEKIVGRVPFEGTSRRSRR